MVSTHMVDCTWRPYRLKLPLIIATKAKRMSHSSWSCQKASRDCRQSLLWQRRTCKSKDIAHNSSSNSKVCSLRGTLTVRCPTLATSMLTICSQKDRVALVKTRLTATKRCHRSPSMHPLSYRKSRRESKRPLSLGKVIAKRVSFRVSRNLRHTGKVALRCLKSAQKETCPTFLPIHSKLVVPLLSNWLLWNIKISPSLLAHWSKIRPSSPCTQCQCNLERQAITMQTHPPSSISRATI